MAQALKPGKLYLIPTPIGEVADRELALPEANRAVLRELDYLVVENLRTARRFLSRMELGRPIDSLTFAELNEHTRPEQVEALLEPVLKEGRDGGVISEAGLPCVADPGAGLVAAAHRHGIEVRPLVGPSSILLALMASGANGQSFAFNGYLPIKGPERARALRHFERRARTEGQTQLFIEAPYRNGRLLEDILSVCDPQTMLCVAVDLLEPTQSVVSQAIAVWRKERALLEPRFEKRPAIFILF